MWKVRKTKLVCLNFALLVDELESVQSVWHVQGVRDVRDIRDVWYVQCVFCVLWLVTLESQSEKNFGFLGFCMNFGQLVEDDDEEDEKAIPKTASVGRGQKCASN